MRLICVFLAVTCVLARPQPPVDITPKNPDAPLTLVDQSKSVLVVGAGIAGLSAALELVERGYNVTVREANQVVGGRVMGYGSQLQHPKAPLTESSTFNVEHG
jgi:heterodisulfide reductase subunit A-like polyferredoxin